MAIYHCSLRVFTRSKGHSAVAAAAYRSGCQLYDERIRKVHRYDKRSGVAETFILLPANTGSEFQSRAFLWNAVEEAEKRKNSCVARELILALPHELSDKERRDLTRDMALYLMERYRVAVDAALHAPVEGDGHDERNHHAHILFSTRELTSQGFGKKTRILDDKVTGKAETELIREVWETLANDALARAGFSDVRIDRRSLEEQGIDRIPQTHMGNSAKHAENLKGSSSHDEDDKDDEEEGEGDKSSSSGRAGGGGGSLPPSLDLEPSELKEKAVKDEARSKYDRGSRADFIEEIKKLNEQRAVYSEIPLKDQITHIDRLMDKLDVRVQHLERLKEGVSLSGKLKRSIEKLMEISVAAILNRKESRAAIKLTESEKQARAERQKTRYGRTYRAGLHEQIREMKHNLEILKTKSQEYTRYKGFVEKIERELDKQPSKVFEAQQNPKTDKHTSNQESSLKLALKASVAREQIPAEYRPKEGFKLTSLKPIAEKTPKDIRNDKAEILNNTHGIETKSPIESNKIVSVSESKILAKVGVEAKAVSEKSRGTFNTKSALDPKVLSDPNPPYRQAIRNFDPLKSQPEKSENKPWLTRGSDKTKPMTDMINSKMAEIRKDQPQAPKQPHDLSRLKGAFNFNAENTKRTTYEVHRAKTRAEADMKRAQMPPEYRAKPYDSESPQAQSGVKGVQDALKSKWESFKAGSQNPPEPEKPRVKISDAFNRESFEGVDKAEQDHSPEEGLDFDIS